MLLCCWVAGLLGCTHTFYDDQVHLIEINLDPDLSHSTKITKQIVPLVVSSLLKQVISTGAEKESTGVDALLWETV